MNRAAQRVAPMLLMSALAVVLAGSGCAVWRVGQAVEMARLSEPFQQRPPGAVVRLLVVGDSTAVGTGALTSTASVAGRLGLGHTGLWVENRARDGARFADVAAQLEGGDRHFDIVLVQAGGNDVIRLSNWPEVRAAVDDVTRKARGMAPLVLLMPAGNVGNAPFFFAPVRGWMTRRSRELHGVVRDVAAQHGAVYVNLFKERDDDPFVLEPGLHARDGLHPSDAGYAVWWQQLMAQRSLDAALLPAR